MHSSARPRLSSAGMSKASSMAEIFQSFLGFQIICELDLIISLYCSVQTIEFAEQRIPVLNEYCVVCDEPHVFQNGPMLRVSSYWWGVSVDFEYKWKRLKYKFVKYSLKLIVSVGQILEHIKWDNCDKMNQCYF